jgi:hypothetical protein
MPRVKPTDAGREGLKAGTAPKTADGLLTLRAVAEAIRRIYAISEAANSTSLTPAGTVPQVGGKRSAGEGGKAVAQTVESSLRRAWTPAQPGGRSSPRGAQRRRRGSDTARNPLCAKLRAASCADLIQSSDSLDQSKGLCLNQHPPSTTPRVHGAPKRLPPATTRSPLPSAPRFR